MQYKLATDSMNDEQLAAHIGEVNKSREPLQQLTLEGAKRVRALRLFRFKKAESYLADSNLADLSAGHVGRRAGGGNRHGPARRAILAAAQ